jgi:hypothetical protein
MFPGGLRTARLGLRPIAAQDAGPIFETYAQGPAVTRFLTWRRHQTREDTDAYVARCVATPAHVSRTDVLADRGSGRVRGAMDLRRPVHPKIGDEPRDCFSYAAAR